VTALHSARDATSPPGSDSYPSRSRPAIEPSWEISAAGAIDISARCSFRALVRFFSGQIAGANMAWPAGLHLPKPPPLKWSDLRYVFDIQEDRKWQGSATSLKRS